MCRSVGNNEVNAIPDEHDVENQVTVEENVVIGWPVAWFFPNYQTNHRQFHATTNTNNDDNNNNNDPNNNNDNDNDEYSCWDSCCYKSDRVLLCYIFLILLLIVGLLYLSIRFNW